MSQLILVPCDDSCMSLRFFLDVLLSLYALWQILLHFSEMFSSSMLTGRIKNYIIFSEWVIRINVSVVLSVTPYMVNRVRFRVRLMDNHASMSWIIWMHIISIYSHSDLATQTVCIAKVCDLKINDSNTKRYYLLNY